MFNSYNFSKRFIISVSLLKINSLKAQKRGGGTPTKQRSILIVLWWEWWALCPEGMKAPNNVGRASYGYVRPCIEPMAGHRNGKYLKHVLQLVSNKN